MAENTTRALQIKKGRDEVRALLDRMSGEIRNVLPTHLTPERLIRITLTAVQTTPKLLECDRRSLLRAVMTAAALGLEPDGVLGQGYLVPYGNLVQFIPGYKGYLTLARNSGEIASIQAHEVFRKDLFEFEYGLEERLRHIPYRDGERFAEGENPIYFYAYAKFKDGGGVFEVLTLHDVLRVRDASQSYQTWLKYEKPKLDKGLPAKSTPWVQHFIQMGRKTAIRRLANYLPLQVQRAAAIESAFEHGRPAGYDEAIGDLTVPDFDVDPETGESTELSAEEKAAETARAKMDAIASSRRGSRAVQQAASQQPAVDATEVEDVGDEEQPQAVTSTAGPPSPPPAHATDGAARGDAFDGLFGAEG